MPTGAALAAAFLIAMSMEGGTKTVDFMGHLFHKIHHHTTAVAYRHVLKPIGHETKKAAKKVGGIE